MTFSVACQAYHCAHVCNGLSETLTGLMVTHHSILCFSTVTDCVKMFVLSSVCNLGFSMLVCRLRKLSKDVQENKDDEGTA